MSQKWPGLLSGKPSGDPTSALPSSDQSAATISAKVCAQKRQLPCTRETETHQEVSFSRTALNSSSNQGSANMHLPGGSSADPPFPQPRRANTVWNRLQLPWHPRRRASGAHTQVPSALPLASNQTRLLIVGQLGYNIFMTTDGAPGL